MKRAANIILLSLSVLMILIMPFVPHHHHKDVECMVVERCISDNTYNDEHTAHPADNGSKDNSLCVKNIQSLNVKSGIHHDWSAVHLFPLLIFTYNELFVDVYRQESPLYDRYTISYKSPIGRGVTSLRAPPHFHS